jgi:hypothetical protein
MTGLDDNEHIESKIESKSPYIDPKYGEKLLQLARSAIEQYLQHGTLPDDPQLESDTPCGSGIFVTLWHEQAPISAVKPATGESSLRGCIGHLQSDIPLNDLVKVVAVAAATRDPRFRPLSLDELNSTRIEIAILSPFRQISDLQQINVGQDGLMIEGTGKRGLLLPKVAVRMGWDRAAFLKNVCRKAGLPLDSWPGIGTLYAFTTTDLDEADYQQN